MDDCGIDFIGIPFKVQAKAGYANSRPKFEEISKYSTEKLLGNFPKENPIHQIPFLLIHKLDTKKRKKDVTDVYVSMSKHDFEQLIRMAYSELIKLPHV